MGEWDCKRVTKQNEHSMLKCVIVFSNFSFIVLCMGGSIVKDLVYCKWIAALWLKNISVISLQSQ